MGERALKRQAARDGVESVDVDVRGRQGEHIPAVARDGQALGACGGRNAFQQNDVVGKSVLSTLMLLPLLLATKANAPSGLKMRLIGPWPVGKLCPESSSVPSG